MTIKDFKKLLKGLPSNTDIAIAFDEENLSPICPTDSHLIQIQFKDNKEMKLVFVLCPCACEPETISNSPELNLN